MNRQSKQIQFLLKNKHNSQWEMEAIQKIGKFHSRLEIRTVKIIEKKVTINFERGNI